MIYILLLCKIRDRIRPAKAVTRSTDAPPWLDTEDNDSAWELVEEHIVENVSVPIVHRSNDGSVPGALAPLSIPMTLPVCMDASRRDAMLKQQYPEPAYLSHRWNNRYTSSGDNVRSRVYLFVP